MQVQVSLTIEIAASASLAEIEQQVQEIGQQAMREAFKQTIRQWEEQQQACPHCGAKQRRLEGSVRRVIATLFGRVQVARRRFRCQACGRRWCPANALFAELQGGTISRPLQEAAWLAGCSWPYRAASAMLKRFCGAEISAEEIRLLLNRQGQLRAAQQQAEASRICAEPPSPSTAAQDMEQRVLVGIDGGWVGSREQRGGMEGKVAVVCAQVVDLPLPKHSSTFSWSRRGPRHPPRQRHQLLKRRYVATFGPAEQLGKLAEAAARSVSDQVRRPVVLLADGAQWIKTQQARHFREATCILDWAHLWRQVRHAIDAAARATPLSARQRDYQVYLHRTWLWYGQVEPAVQGLRTLASGLPAEARETITKAITYLENQRPWIGSYEHWRELGYPVGSGMIERAVALVINRRMKKRGMRWCRANATAVVALRTDLLNEDWILPQRLRSFP
jgi:hypothetical protein